MADPNASKGWSQPQDALRLFPPLLAHCDQGVDHVIADVAHRLPNKEIWVTEWSPRASDYTVADQPPPMMMALLAARMTSAYLRHKEITMALFFTMNFNRQTYLNMFQPDGKGGYQAVPEAVALRWFNEAANGGAPFQRYVEAGAKPVAGGGWRQESFQEVEADVFRKGDHTILILENCGAQARQFQIPAAIETHPPAKVETLSASDVTTPENIQSITQPGAGADVRIPAYSLTRIVW